MQLYDHQKTIIEEDPIKTLLALGTGGGKTRLGLELAKKRILVIVPKQQKLDETWERNAEKFGIDKDITIISKETFRRDHAEVGYYDTLIIDEVHYCLGVYPDEVQRKGTNIPKTSKLFDAVHWWVHTHKPERMYLLSATPAPKPMNAFAISRLLGLKWDFIKFRDRFYREFTKGYRTIWIQKKDKATTALLVDIVKSFGYTGQLSDWFDVPEQTHREIYVGVTPDQKKLIKEITKTEADPMVARAKMRTIENGVLYDLGVTELGGKEQQISRKSIMIKDEKLPHIEELAMEFPKLLIFAAYTGQVEKMEDHLTGLGYNVKTLTGKTKDRGTVIQEADTADECIVIAQSSISSGYELPTFPCVVFASKSHKLVDYIQGLGRVLRANHIKRNLYVHLITKHNLFKGKKGSDESCHEAIMYGEDYQEAVMSQ